MDFGRSASQVVTSCPASWNVINISVMGNANFSVHSSTNCGFFDVNASTVKTIVVAVKFFTSAVMTSGLVSGVLGAAMMLSATSGSSGSSRVLHVFTRTGDFLSNFMTSVTTSTRLGMCMGVSTCFGTRMIAVSDLFLDFVMSLGLGSTVSSPNVMLNSPSMTGKFLSTAFRIDLGVVFMNVLGIQFGDTKDVQFGNFEGGEIVSVAVFVTDSPRRVVFLEHVSDNWIIQVLVMLMKLMLGMSMGMFHMMVWMLMAFMGGHVRMFSCNVSLWMILGFNCSVSLWMMLRFRMNVSTLVSLGFLVMDFFQGFIAALWCSRSHSRELVRAILDAVIGRAVRMRVNPSVANRTRPITWSLIMSSCGYTRRRWLSSTVGQIIVIGQKVVSSVSSTHHGGKEGEKNFKLDHVWLWQWLLSSVVVLLVCDGEGVQDA